MKIAITGASGLVGSALGEHLRARGDTVMPISRGDPGGTQSVHWSLEGGIQPAGALSGCDAVVHLAGENLAARRWSRRQKERILESRVAGTRAVVSALAAAEEPRPRVLVSASAVGVYGDRGDTWLAEDAELGDDFLAQVCHAWEAEAMKASALGVRVVSSRTGIVLSRQGGSLPRLLRVFRLGIGGRLGHGQQYFSWIHVRDTVRAIAFAIDDARVEGPLNVASPCPVTNAELTRALARALRRPAILPVPGFALRIVLGELARALLAGQRVEPARLRELGFQFEFDHLRPALEDLLSGPQPRGQA